MDVQEMLGGGLLSAYFSCPEIALCIALIIETMQRAYFNAACMVSDIQKGEVL